MFWFKKKEVEYSQDFLRYAHKHSSSHRAELKNSDSAGCFYCCKVFPSTAVIDWVLGPIGDQPNTACCPYCGIDSVIGDASKLPINEHFLITMKKFWF